ncbi:uncharacterized protein LOC119768922 [Culex quinquefasciatus]|uniref:uncharacterized protein LOC119768922 n=1 Tax=Culex quinquefasciatus TaxID=7176 RepID=UPI0018E2BC5D|nr:uncharacterized protein LOC119768922 [Culex quinquefasciatus]
MGRNSSAAKSGQVFKLHRALGNEDLSSENQVPYVCLPVGQHRTIVSGNNRVPVSVGQVDNRKVFLDFTVDKRPISMRPLRVVGTGTSQAVRPEPAENLWSSTPT